jgi:aminopeptidase N
LHFLISLLVQWKIGGLVTYRSIYLLYDELKSSLKAKQGVAYVVGHELAHHWFGNLVQWNGGLMYG